MKKKILASVVAVALVACCVIGGTLAWLTDKTDSKVNTFTVGDVNIDLTETTTTYKILPGTEIRPDRHRLLPPDCGPPQIRPDGSRQRFPA